MKELIDQLHAAWNDLWNDLSSSTDDLTEIGRLVAEIKKMADESFVDAIDKAQFSFSGRCNHLGRIDCMDPSFVADIIGQNYVALEADGGRVVALIGLTYDECRTFADAFATEAVVRIEARTYFDHLEFLDGSIATESTGRSAKYQPSDETERMSHPGTRSA